MDKRSLVLLLASGCVPFAVPPVTGNLGAQWTTEVGNRAGLHVDVGFSPLQLTESQFDRGWDATLAGSYDRMGTEQGWGVAAFGGPIMTPRALQGGAKVRVLPQVVARWTTDGASAGLRLAIERVSFESGSRTGTGQGAGVHGEAAIGLYLESGYRSDEEWSVVAGLTLRIPAMVGLACCLR